MSGLILSMAPWAQAAVAFAVAMLLTLLGPQQYAAWGWRVLFAAGALLSVGMLLYYRRQVSDAPLFTQQQEALPATGPGTAPAPVPAPAPAPTLRSLLTGSWSRAFWQVFAMMTGLWLLTYTTVLLLTERLSTDAPLEPIAVPIVMGLASVAQAVAMALAGHLSTLVGRRRLLMIWGAAATVTGPLLWWLAVTSPTLAMAAACAALLQIATVAAYGPIAAYLSERFPTSIRSTGYGAGYSLSLVLPALYPFYVPALEPVLGRHGTVLALIVLGGLLLVIGAARGPRLRPRELDADLDTVATGSLQ
ncbi:MFS transporter [Brachybacterium avium]|uniref:MFS transporter n=1 Tax=Brachybacterium avium TaxID=2017485 RepID=UPI001FEBB6BC|nr:MFS transporter [Brachybacterium avium]